MYYCDNDATEHLLCLNESMKITMHFRVAAVAAGHTRGNFAPVIMKKLVFFVGSIQFSLSCEGYLEPSHTYLLLNT